MSLLIVILILIFGAAIGISAKARPKQPPIEDMNEHLKKVMAANTIRERRKIR